MIQDLRLDNCRNFCDVPCLQYASNGDDDVNNTGRSILGLSEIQINSTNGIPASLILRISTIR